MEKVYLDMYKDGKKVAEADVTKYTLDQIKHLTAIEVEEMGREVKIRREGKDNEK